MCRKKNQVLEDLKKANVKGMRFYAKEDMPSQYHYKNNQRIGPIILVAEKGYFIRGVSFALEKSC